MACSFQTSTSGQPPTTCGSFSRAKRIRRGRTSRAKEERWKRSAANILYREIRDRKHRRQRRSGVSCESELRERKKKKKKKRERERETRGMNTRDSFRSDTNVSFQ